MSEKVEGDKYFSNMSLADLQHGLSDLISTPHNFSSLFFLFSQICSKLFSYKAVQYGRDLDGASRGRKNGSRDVHEQREIARACGLDGRKLCRTLPDNLLQGL